MKFIKVIILLLFLSASAIAQQSEKEFKEYSYAELFEMIENEMDTLFVMEDAFIVLNPKTDKRFIRLSRNDLYQSNIEDTIWVEKEIHLNNVIFELNYSLNDSLNNQILPDINHVVFTKRVEMNNSFGTRFSNCLFKERFVLWNDEITSTVKNVLPRLNNRTLGTEFNSCVFENRITYSNFPLVEDTINYYFALEDSEIRKKSSDEDASLALIQMREQFYLQITNNKFLGEGWVFIFPHIKDFFEVEDNDFGDSKIFMRPSGDIPNLNFLNNKIDHPIILDFPTLNSNANIGWDQLNGKIIHQGAFDNYVRNMSEYGLDTIASLAEGHFRSKKKKDFYLNNLRIQKQDAFNQEVKIRGKLYRLYKDQYQTQDANSVYMELKDLETQRLEFQFNQSPSFNKYFKWKVNQFLKVFSNYGTEPAKAVTFSFYVVIFFALIYLFFPNSWDRHGRNRIINRYRFFTKYMHNDAGIHELYLDEQKEELLEYEEFRTFMQSSSKSMPKFFISTALPIYKWAVSGTKLSASLLKRVDIMKGTWTDLPKHKRIWKSVLLIGAFLTAVGYDIFIKMLNAIMLSINTFTTLGFGEIPIKGLPRYLAIIQGFIGWFMLTIFSVSLISQLLN